jgi:PAS domain S-box-containing protein
MKSIPDLSIRNKIVAIILLVTYISISLGFTFTVVWILNMKKSEIQSELLLNTQLVGDNCVVPLTFGDHQQATEALSRLRYISFIEEGSLYDREGNLFAMYPDTLSEASFVAPPGQQYNTFQDGYFYIREPVLFQDEMYGTLYIKANSSPLTDVRRTSILVFSLTVLALVFLSAMLAGRMQRYISMPILKLKNHIDEIAENQDFSAHLTKLYNDEVGSLYDGFNNMLNQIYIRQEARRKAEEALRASEKKFRSVFENSPLGKSMTGIDGSLQVNRSFCDILGYSEEELKTKNWQEITHADDIRESADIVQSLIDGQKNTARYEKRYIHKNGSIVWTDISTTLHRDSDNNPLYFITAVNDITDKKILTDSLRETKDYLENLIACANAPIIVWDQQFKITRFNKAFELLTGRSEKEVIGQSINILFPPEQVLHSMKLIKKAQEGKSLETVEISILHKDGSARIVLWNSALVFDEDGETPLATIAQGQDITGRKLAEETLKVSEIRYRRLFEAARDGILILDAESGLVLDVNPFLIEMLGFTREQFLGKSLWDLGFLKDIAENKSNFKELQQKEFIHYENLPLKTAKGQLINVEFVSHVYQVDHHKVMQCNIRNITKRIKDEEEIKNNEKRFRELIESLPQLFWTCTVDGPCDYLSKQWVEYTGIPEAEQLGYRWLEQLHPEDRDRTISTWMEKVINRESFNIEFRIRKNNGEYRWFKTRAVPIHDNGGNIIKWFGSNTDFDDVIKAREKINQLNKDLEKRVIERTTELQIANKELEAFSYSVSHDLRAPLRAINGFIQMLLEDYVEKLDDEGKRIGAIIQGNSRKMGVLIDDLLAFSRLNRMKMALSRINMEELVREAVKELEDLGTDRKIGITIRHLPQVKGDRSLLKQVITNLLSNSIKFTRPREEAVIEIGNFKKDHQSIYYIKDNGVGFNMKYADKIFDVFQRLHSEKEFEGTGIGLALVHRIISRHGGKIWVEAELNKGATFYFTFTR